MRGLEVRYHARMTASGQSYRPYTTPTFVDNNFELTLANQLPADFPSTRRLGEPGPQQFWWVFRDPTQNNAGFVAWTNLPSLLLKARALLSGLSNDSLGWDGRAIGPMGNERVPVIDLPLLRRLWVWMRRAQREGRYVPEGTLARIEEAGRSGNLQLGLLAPLILATFHAGGATGGSRFALIPGASFAAVADGNLPRMDVPASTFGVEIFPKAFINNLGNVPTTGIGWLDEMAAAERMASQRQPSPPPAAQPPTPAPQPPPPPPNWTRVTPGTSPLRQTTEPATPIQTVLLAGGDPSQPKPTTTLQGGPQGSSVPSQTTLAGTSQPTTRPGTAQPQPDVGGRSGPGISAAATSLTDVAKNAWPYAVAAAVVLGVAGAIYYATSRDDR